MKTASATLDHPLPGQGQPPPNRLVCRPLRAGTWAQSLLLLLACLLAVQPLSAQKAQEEKHRNISLEFNPLAYAFGGWSIGAAYQSPQLPHWVFSAGAYSFPFPKVFVEQIAGNEGKGFGVKLRLATSVGADVYPWRKDRAGLAFGLAAVLGNFELTQAAETGRARYRSLYVVPRASYTWYIVKGLYIMPWLGVELHSKVSGSTMVGTKTFAPIRYQFSPNLMIGYAF